MTSARYMYVVANSRAEMGPLTSVIAALPEARVIGFNIDGTIPPHREMATALHWFTDKLRDASLVVLLGDRFETLAAALACCFLRVPLCHLHGGETTTGAFDDAFRDAITRLTTITGGLHLCATQRALVRVHALNGSYVGTYLVGAPGLDSLVQNSAKRDQRLIVVSYYPETLSADYGVGNCELMLAALEEYAAGYAIFFSSVNADPGAVAIQSRIQVFIDAHHTSASWISPDTREQYLHLVEHAAVVVGNGSAGVIECPWLGVPSVNIGMRQHGREMAHSVTQFDDVVPCIPFVLENADDLLRGSEPIYRGGAAPKIAEVVREFIASRENPLDVL